MSEIVILLLYITIFRIFTSFSFNFIFTPPLKYIVISGYYDVITKKKSCKGNKNQKRLLYKK